MTSNDAMTKQLPEGADGRLTARQLDAVSGGAIYNTEYWIKAEIGGKAWVYDGEGNCMGEFASSAEAHRWIRNQLG